jgi:cystathionine gamma-synthase
VAPVLNGHPRPQPADELDPATLVVHAGRTVAPGEPLSPPPALASVYRAGEALTYAREGNPTWSAFERAIAALEGAADAVAFSSGMGAAVALLGKLDAGSRVVVAHSAHVEVRRLLAELEDDRVLRVELADAGDPDAFVAALDGAALAWIDSISNPTLEVAAVGAIAAGARARGVTLVVDSTLATPILQRPLALGADAVLHSASKYLGGHSDLLLGVVATRDHQRSAGLRRRRERLGATPGTMEAWLALRGLRTLELRLKRGQASAAVLAGRLASHPDVLDVRYPGLAHPGAIPWLAGPGAMISFSVAGGPGRADAVCDAVRLITNAGSLGGVETLIERHARWHDEPSVPAALLRVSVGCEDADDLWRDLSRALAETAGAAGTRPVAVRRRAEPAPAA